MKLKSGVYQSCFNIRDTNDNPVECSRDRINQIARISANKDISGAMVFLRLTELINSDFSLNKAGIENAIELISLLRDDQHIIVSVKSNWFGCKKSTNVYYHKDWNEKGFGKFFKYDGKTITCLAYWDLRFAKSIGEVYGAVANVLGERCQGFHAIHWGELSQPVPKGREAAYLAGVKQVLTSVRETSPNVEIGTGPNFIAGGESAMRSYLKHCGKIGNTITLPPDLIKCRKTGTDRCGPGCGDSKVEAYDFYGDYDIRKAGQMQNYDVHWDDHEQDYKWATEWGAEVIVQQQMSYWTRDTRSADKNGSPDWWNYCNELAKKYAPIIKRSKRLDMPDKYSLRPKNFSLPGEFQTFEENEFGFPVIQATRAKTIKGEKFPPSKFEYIRAAKYPTTQSFFGKYLMTYEGAAGVSFLLNKSDGSFVKLLRHGLYDAHWLPGSEDNPYLVGVHQRSGKLKKFAVETDELVDLDFKVLGITSKHTAGKSEGTMTRSGKILYTRQAGRVIDCVLVDYANKTSVELFLDAQGGTLNTASVSDCGKWIIGMYNNGAGGGIYKYKVASGALKPVKKYSDRSHHAVLTVHKGKSVYVIMSEIVDGARMVVAYYLDGDRRVVIQGGPGQFTNDSRSKGKALTGHVGLGAITDDDTYVTVSYMDPEGPHTAGLVSLSTGKFYPVAYTHHAPTYLAQAHSVTAYEGDRMVMAAFDNGVRICLIVDITSLGLSTKNDKPELPEEPVSDDIPVHVDPESPVSPLPEITEPATERESDPGDVPDGKEGRIRRILAAIKLALEKFL